MRKNILRCFINLLIPAFFVTPGFAATQSLRPTFTKSRQFFIEKPQEAEEVFVDPTNVKILLFKKAKNHCGLSKEFIQTQMAELLSKDSPLWSQLDSLFTNSFLQVHSRKIEILIDDFSDFGSTNPVFASYYLRSPIEAIGLDCSPRARAYWLPSLAHELTHALLADRNVESWFEEGLAQLNERGLGGMQPELTLKSLQQAPAVLSFRETHRPLPSRQSYALSFLFVRYIYAVFGGYPTLQSMIEPVKNINYLDGIADNAQQILSSQQSLILSADKMTRQGLIRFFYMALCMKNTQDPRYQIPGWNGFENLSTLTIPVKLEPGQAAVFSHENFKDYLLKYSANIPGYEIYTVYEGTRGQYLIAPYDKNADTDKQHLPSFTVQRSFTLMISN